MNTENILNFFTRREKSLLGVCSELSRKFNLPPVALRIVLIVLTFLFIPLGIIVYIGLYLTFNQKKSRMVTFGLLGLLLGIPLSYYFQSNIIKNYGGNSGMFSYLRNFTRMVDEYNKFIGNGWDIIYNVFLSMVIFALIGGAVGHFIGQKGKKE